MRFNLEKFADYETIKSLIIQANAHSDVVLLDLDETIVSHKSYVFDRIMRYLEALPGYQTNPELTEKLIERIQLDGTNEILNFVSKDINHAAKVKDLLVFLRSDIAIPPEFFRPGTKEILTRLHYDFTLRICTNGNELQQRVKMKYLEQMLGFKISTFFCSSTVPKPSPLCLKAALGNFSPGRALFIGDSNVDLLAAERASIKFINVSNLLSSA